ncbi:MAG: phytanoyl-CoA dioxygenase family protein [Planctomycetota bacterium]|nr:phytanoyl-CoA dioxygenase family protein [Planctomycetota bacterium]
MVRDWRETWEREGYLVVPGIFEAARVERLRAIADGIHEQWIACDPQTGQPRSNPDEHCMRHLNHAAYFHDRPAADFSELMDAVADDLILGIARAILRETPLFRCTTYWFNPRKTSVDGNWHRDLQFMAKSEEEERRRMEAAIAAGESAIQMQIPLVDSDDIEFVPRSHLRWDTPAEYEIRCAHGRANNTSNRMPGALRLALKAGDAALFNPNGLHRGRYHADKPRRTLMFTYTKASRPLFDYFSDQPWFREPGYLDRLTPRTRAFFEPFVAEYQDRWKQAQELQPA